MCLCVCVCARACGRRGWVGVRRPGVVRDVDEGGGSGGDGSWEECKAAVGHWGSKTILMSREVAAGPQ